MRIVHLCQAPFNGGFIAAWRFHRALLDHGVDSIMVVRDRKGATYDGLVAVGDSFWWRVFFRIRGALSRVLHWLLLGRGSIRETYLQWIPTGIPGWIRRKFQPDILHIHTPGDGLWGLREMGRYPGKVAWTFHSLRDFSQGYLFLGNLLQSWRAEGCVGSLHDRDRRLFAFVNLWAKHRCFNARTDLCFSPSVFVREAALVSGVYGRCRHVLMRNCLDDAEFHPGLREGSRHRMGLDDDAFVIMTGASSLEDTRKGFDLAMEALALLCERGAPAPALVLVTVGAGGETAAIPSGISARHLGPVAPEEMPGIYAASDLLLVPSREDNFPNVILEALACGTPYLGFDSGGVGEMAREDPACGAVVPAFDTTAMAAEIRGFLGEDMPARRNRREACRAAVLACCGAPVVARRAAEAYTSHSRTTP